MFSLNSLRRNWARSVFTLFAVAFLLTALLFSSCKTEPDEGDLSIIGSWKYTYSGGEESYFISSTRFEYGGYSALKGDVHEIKYFNKSSGVIIIEYDADSLPQYYEYGDAPDYAVISGPVGPLGKFQGIFFSGLTNTSVKLANASDTSGNDKYFRAEVATLELAISSFTADNVDLFIWGWGGVNSQTRQ